MKLVVICKAPISTASVALLELGFGYLHLTHQLQLPYELPDSRFWYFELRQSRPVVSTGLDLVECLAG